MYASQNRPEYNLKVAFPNLDQANPESTVALYAQTMEQLGRLVATLEGGATPLHCQQLAQKVGLAVGLLQKAREFGRPVDHQALEPLVGKAMNILAAAQGMAKQEQAKWDQAQAAQIQSAVNEMFSDGLREAIREGLGAQPGDRALLSLAVQVSELLQDSFRQARAEATRQRGSGRSVNAGAFVVKAEPDFGKYLPRQAQQASGVPDAQLPGFDASHVEALKSMARSLALISVQLTNVTDGATFDKGLAHFKNYMRQGGVGLELVRGYCAATQEFAKQRQAEFARGSVSTLAELSAQIAQHNARA